MFRIFQTQKKIDRNNLDGAQTRETKMKKLGLNLSEHYSIPITLALQFVSIKTKLGIFGVREFVTQNKIKHYSKKCWMMKENDGNKEAKLNAWSSLLVLMEKAKEVHHI